MHGCLVVELLRLHLPVLGEGHSRRHLRFLYKLADRTQCEAQIDNFSTNLQTVASNWSSVVLDELSVFLSRQGVVQRLEECIFADEASGVFLPRIQNLCLPHLIQRFTLF